jgi:hypothetical protein
MFDADARAEALELPQIKVGGKTYTGKLLSAPVAAKLVDQFETMQGEEIPLTELVKLLGEVYDAAGFPVAILEQVPLALVPEALEDFFACQVSAMEKTANRKTRRATKSTA